MIDNMAMIMAAKNIRAVACTDGNDEKAHQIEKFQSVFQDVGVYYLW